MVLGCTSEGVTAQQLLKTYIKTRMKSDIITGFIRAGTLCGGTGIAPPQGINY